MPKLVHVSRSGETKAKLSELQVGDSLVFSTRAAARACNGSALRLGLRLTIRRIVIGQPAHRITRLA